MARMHSGAHGKSGSTKPIVKKTPSWVRYKARETELLVVKLAKEGKTPSQIGIFLRDVYGIPSVRTVSGKKVAAILKAKKLLTAIPEDLNSLIKKAITVRKHLGDNHKDMTAKRGLQLTESKIRRLVKHHKKTGRISQEWTYDPDKIKLMID